MAKIDANQITAIAAVIVSCAALFVAWDQVRIMRLQQKAAVMPLMRISWHLDFEKEIHSVSVEVENVGVGPGFIRGERVVWQGKRLKRWTNFAKSLFPDGLPSGSSMSMAGQSITGGLVASGDRATMIRLSWPSNKKNEERTSEQLLKLFGNPGDSTALEVTLCYCSVFDQCWMTQETESEPPVETKECPTEWVPVSLDFKEAQSLKKK